MPLLEVPKELPFLKAICWQVADITSFTPEEMLISYERGWRYLDVLGEPSQRNLSLSRHWFDATARGWQAMLEASEQSSPSPKRQQRQDTEL